MPELARVQFGHLHQLARDVREVGSLGLQEAQDRLGCARKREQAREDVRKRAHACLAVQQDGSAGAAGRVWRMWLALFASCAMLVA